MDRCKDIEERVELDWLDKSQGLVEAKKLASDGALEPRNWKLESEDLLLTEDW